MSPERTQAYRRVLLTLQELGPSKLLADEQERIRQAADNLIFSADLADADALQALAETESLCHALVDSGRWTEMTAARLAKDLRECGPDPITARQAGLAAA
jgi:hypothetical protein